MKSRFWYLLFWLLWASNINLNTISISIRSQNKLSRDITNYNSKKQKMISTPTAYFVDLALAFQFSERKMGLSSWSDRQLSLVPCIISQLRLLTQKSIALASSNKNRKLLFHNHQNDQSALLLHNHKAKLKQKSIVPMAVYSSFFLLQFPLRKLSKTSCHALLLTEEQGDIENYVMT